MHNDTHQAPAKTSRRGVLTRAAAASAAALVAGRLIDARRAEATLGDPIRVGGAYAGDQLTEVGGTYAGPILNLWNSDVAGSANVQAVGLTASIGLDYALPPAGRSAAVFARNGRNAPGNDQYTCGVLGQAETTGGAGVYVGVLGESSGAGGTRVGVEGRSNNIGVRGLGGRIGVIALGQTAEATGLVATGQAIGVAASSVGGVGLRASSSGTALDVVGKSTFSDLLTSTAGAEFGGPVTAVSFTGDGSELTNVNPAPHNHNASFINAGTLADARLSANVPLKDAVSNVFTGGVRAATYAGDGASITGLNASNVIAGTLADARLTRNIPRRNARVTPFAGAVRAAQFSGLQGKPPAFSGLGTAQVPAGAKEVRIRARGVGPGVHVLGLFQTNPGDGVALAHVEKLRSGFKAVLNAPATRQATLAFFVVREP